MPQPIRHPNSISFDFSPAAISKRPILAPYIGITSAYWNDIEARIAIYIAALLEKEAETVISIFLALTSDHAKQATIETITSLKLTTDQKEKFNSVMKTVKKRYKERNMVIHGSWGISPQYQDDLLWYDPRESVAMFPAMMTLTYEKKLGRMRDIEQTFSVWEEQDFINLISRLKKAHEELIDFTKPVISPWMNLRAELPS